MRGYPDHLMHGPRLIGGGFMFLITLLILGLLVYLVILVKRDRNDAITTYTPSAPTGPSSPGLLTPTEVVKMRYARGEITREEYETIRRDLE
jgi:putative membrane protein